MVMHARLVTIICMTVLTLTCVRRGKVLAPVCMAAFVRTANIHWPRIHLGGAPMAFCWIC